MMLEMIHTIVQLYWVILFLPVARNLLSFYHMPDTVPGPGNTAINKKTKKEISAFTEPTL